MIFKNNKVYDVLKWLSLVAFDAVGVAYKGLAEVWHLPYGTEILTTCTIISAFIGALIGLSSYKYAKADVDITTELEDELLLDREGDDDETI